MVNVQYPTMFPHDVDEALVFNSISRLKKSDSTGGRWH